jgi:myosin-5
MQLFSDMAFVLIFEGELARSVYRSLRREAASLKIQTSYRMHNARKAYTALSASALIIQSSLRGMAARKEIHFRRQTRAAIIIQVA